MWKICLLVIFLFSFSINLNAEEINFPPELLWWIYEVKKANPKIEIKNFTLRGKETEKFGVDDFYQGGLIYPVFMRWNYSGNFVAYNGENLTRKKSGKYQVGDFDDNSALYIADKNKKIFFARFFGVREGLNAIFWLTDTVLIGVGININDEEIYNVDLFIIEYRINDSNKTVEIKYYQHDNALKNDDRLSLKLNWYEQRADYFEIERSN